jgi:hypothetical protein
MKIKFFPILLIFSSVMIFAESCSKKGDPGKDGVNGVPGNTVNVSDSFQLVNADYANGYWSVETGGGGSLGISAKIATRDVAKITPKIFTSGTVLVYMKVPNGLSGTSTQYTLLPFSVRSFNVGYLTRTSFAYETGKLRIYYYYEQTDAAGAAAPNIITATVPTYSFRYVIIPGSEGFRTNPPVDYNDYEAVVRYYHL